MAEKQKSKPKPKVIGYIRMSSKDQDTEKNKDEILRFADNEDFGKVKFVTEHVSGRKSWKTRQIKKVMESCGENDILITPELSRLGRSTLEVLEILKEATEKKLKVYSVKEKFCNDDDVKTTVMATLFTLFAQLERDFISMRTKEALATKKRAGVKLGRPPGPGKSKLDPYREEIIELLQNGSQKKFVAQRYDTSPENLTLWIRSRKLQDEVKPVVKPSQMPEQQKQVDRNQKS